MQVRLPVLLVLCAVIAAACTAESSAVFSATSEPVAPAPAGDTVLTLQSEGSMTSFDLAALESRFPLHEGTVYEPFEERELTFTGVLLRDVLRDAIESGATEVEMVALDDYHVVFDLDELQSADALLATRQDGAPIPIDEGGPTRVVFTDASQVGSNPDVWIWNVASMEAR